MPPIRVLYVVPNLATGGLERMVHLLATRLDPARFAPSVHVFDFVGELATVTQAMGVPVRYDRRKPGFLDVSLVRVLARRMRQERPDVVHAHNVTALVYAAIAATLAGAVPLVHTEHDRAFGGGGLGRIVHGLAGRRADRMVVVAEWIRSALVRWERLPAERIEVVPNGVEEERFTAPIDRGFARATLDLPRTAPVVSCIARLAAVKNHPALLRAWRRVVDRMPGATLLLAGVGPDQWSLESLASSLGLDASVRFLGDRNDVPSILAASDLHALTSHSEGLSLTLLEAMAAARPSVATAVGGNPEILEHGRTGLLVPAGDVGGIAEAVLTLLHDRPLGERMGAAARETFLRRYTLRAMVGAYQRIYEEVV